MKLQFESNLDYQIDAINAVIDLFQGLPNSSRQNDFSRAKNSNQLTIEMDILQELVTGNELDLSDQEQLLKNLNQIQRQNKILPSQLFLKDDNYTFPNFSVEMETGTGKTYVYLRTIFELNKKYGLNKFIIVVPSVAIREGVLSSLKLMGKHFNGLYDHIPFDYFIYESKDLSKVRQFAISNNIQIMIINIQAFQKDMGDIKDYSQLTEDERKKLNIIHQEQDKMSGRRPIEYIQATRPIVIIDEPQSVDNTTKSQRAISNLNPLFCLRYSATHTNSYNLLYKLDPIQAYDLKLVKQIEVASVQSETNFNEVFIRLDSIFYPKNSKTPQAKVTIHDYVKGKSKEKQIIIKQGTDLSQKTNKSGYDGYIINNICAEKRVEQIEFSNGKILKLYQEEGGMTEEVLKAQIYQTMEEHLKKEKRFKDKGIKVLSLFFVDSVANYRFYDDKGNAKKGKFAYWFEEAYFELLKKETYKGLLTYPVDQVHNGYFSVDKGKIKDTKGNTKSDEETYNLIMKDKEKLLSIDEPLRFIFSHSALKEGWDNPNVFQICTLREIGTEKERRQTLGRGLRLPVNQEGMRIRDENINKLTVIAGESFEEYAKGLQEDLEKDLGDNFKFGRIEKNVFAQLIDHKNNFIGEEKSAQIWQELANQEYINKQGDLTDKFQPEAIKLSSKFEIMREDVINIIENHTLKNRIVNAKERRTLTYNKQIILNEDFRIIWDKIKQKTRYSVEFETNELIKKAVKKINEMNQIQPLRIFIDKTEMNISEAGIQSGKTLDSKTELTTLTNNTLLPDILAFLQRETQLTRHTLVQILKQSNRLDDFTINPETFMTEVAKQINFALKEMAIDGIKYEKLAGEYYDMKLFEEQELEEYLSRLYTVQSQDNRTLYDYIPFDSEIEKDIAEKLDTNENVKFFCKLPRWFHVSTPVGNYNPDWAIVLERDEKIYLVRETKSTHDESKRRVSENQKVKYGKAHFDAINMDYQVTTNIQEFLSVVNLFHDHPNP